MRPWIGLFCLTLFAPPVLPAQADRALEAGERLVILSEDGAVRLAVTDTELRFRFTAEGVRNMEREIERDLEDEPPLARWMAQLVGTTVTQALAGVRVALDVCVIGEVSFADEHLVFRHRGKRGHDHGRSRLGSFRPDDAERLIAELEAVKGERCLVQ